MLTTHIYTGFENPNIHTNGMLNWHLKKKSNNKKKPHSSAREVVRGF